MDRDIQNLRYLLEPGVFAKQELDDPAADEFSRIREERLQGAPVELPKANDPAKPGGGAKKQAK